MKPEISIIVPVFNAEKYLAECLDSILNQSFKDVEVIIVNDGSTDSSWRIIQEYAKKDKRIVTINQKNMGVKEARINGYKVARGEYVSWIDNDDITSKKMYDLMHRKAVSVNADIVICNYDFYPKNISTKQKWFKSYRGRIDWRFVSHNTLLWNKLFRKDFTDKINFVGYMSQLGEASFILPLLLTNSVATIDIPLHKYRVGHGSQSNMQNIAWYEENYRLSLKREKILEELDLKNQWGSYAGYLTTFSLMQLLIVFAYNDNKKEYAKYRQKIRESRGIKKELFREVVIKEYGTLKYLVFRYITPNSFHLTKLASRRVS